MNKRFIVKLSCSLGLSLCFNAESSANTAQVQVAVLYPASNSSDIDCYLNSFMKNKTKETQNLVQVSGHSYHDGYANLQKSIDAALKVKPSVIIGPMLSHEVLASQIQLSQFSIPQILPIATSPSAAFASEQTVPMLPASDHYAALLADHISKSYPSLPLLIYARKNLEYSTYYATTFKAALSQKDESSHKIRDVKTIEYQSPESIHVDIADTQKGETLIFAPVSPSDLALIYAQIPNDQSVTIFTQYAQWESQEFISTLKKPRVKIIYNGIIDPKPKSALATREWQRFERIYKNHCQNIAPKPWTYAIHDSLELINRASIQSKNLTARALRQTNFYGMLGPWKLDARRPFPMRDLSLYKMTHKSKQGIYLRTVQFKQHKGSNASEALYD